MGSMNFKQALEIVHELADQNKLNALQAETFSLELQAYQQQQALIMVGAFIDSIENRTIEQILDDPEYSVN